MNVTLRIQNEYVSRLKTLLQGDVAVNGTKNGAVEAKESKNEKIEDMEDEENGIEADGKSEDDQEEASPKSNGRRQAKKRKNRVCEDDDVEDADHSNKKRATDKDVDHDVGEGTSNRIKDENGSAKEKKNGSRSSGQKQQDIKSMFSRA